MKRLILFLIIVILATSVYSKLINVNVEVNEISKKVHPGDEVFVQVSLVNVAMNKEDITLEYYIIDEYRNVIDTESETVLMTTRIDRVRSLELPDDTKKGKYSFVVKIIYKEEVIGAASDLFEVIEEEKPARVKEDYIIIIIIFIFFILFMFYEYIKFKQIEKLIKKVNERNMRRYLK